VVVTTSVETMKLMKLLAARLKLVDVPLPSSPADHGKSIYKQLAAINAISNVQPVDGEPSVFTSAEVAHAESLRSGNNENVLVSHFTPRLQEIVSSINPKMHLYNSEVHKWLQAPSGAAECEMKPDLFVAYDALVERRDPYKNAPECATPRQFGIFPCWSCRASLWCLFGAKWELSDTALGEKVKYLECCGANCRLWADETPTLKLILFDAKEFWMIEGKSTSITKITKCPWDRPGSWAAFRSFVQTPDPWMNSVDYLLQDLALQLKTVAMNESQILGAGAYGRAFWLEDGRVLKVAVGPDAGSLEGEYNLLLRLQRNDKTRHFIIPIVEDTYRHYKIDGVSFTGYVLESKGEKITSSCPRLTHHQVTDKNLTPSAQMTRLVTFLHQLHQTGHVHGDPRIDNILSLNGELKFIDMMQTTLFSITAKVNDFTLLFNSLTGVSTDLIRLRIEAIFDPVSQLTTGITRLHTIVPSPPLPPSPSETVDPILAQLHQFLAELWG
jgi:hypothetical protein